MQVEYKKTKQKAAKSRYLYKGQQVSIEKFVVVLHI